MRTRSSRQGFKHQARQISPSAFTVPGNTETTHQATQRLCALDCASLAAAGTLTELRLTDVPYKLSDPSSTHEQEDTCSPAEFE